MTPEGVLTYTRLLDDYMAGDRIANYLTTMESLLNVAHLQYKFQSDVVEGYSKFFSFSSAN